MPSLTKSQFKLISNLVQKRSLFVKKTPAWVALHETFCIGKMDGKLISFTHQDLRKWQELTIAATGLNPLDKLNAGNRTEMALHSHDEKWATVSTLKTRIFCTGLNADLHLSEARVCAVIPTMEYRLDYRELNLDHYDAIMVVENFEAFIFIHSFTFSWSEKILVIYRGHDIAARAAIDFIKNVTIPVYGFFDPDPSGLGMLMDNPVFTHAVMPSIKDLNPKNALASRFERQISGRNNLKEKALNFSEGLQLFVSHIMDNGVAYNQESLAAREIPLQLIKIK